MSNSEKRPKTVPLVMMAENEKVPKVETSGSCRSSISSRPEPEQVLGLAVFPSPPTPTLRPVLQLEDYSNLNEVLGLWDVS